MNDLPDGDVTAFDALVGPLDYPMFVVTAAAGGELAGCLAGFVTQCSIDRPALLVCLSDKNRTFRVAHAASRLAVHFLGREDADLAELFGSSSGDDVDKFSRCEWQALPDGTPVLSRCRGWAVGPIVRRVDLGDHRGLLVPVERARAGRPDGPPLGYQDVRGLRPGHSP